MVVIQVVLSEGSDPCRSAPKDHKMNYYLALVLIFSLLSVAFGASTVLRKQQLTPTNTKGQDISWWRDTQDVDGSAGQLVPFIDRGVQRRKKRQSDLFSRVNLRDIRPTKYTKDNGYETDTDGYTTCEENNSDRPIRTLKKCRKIMIKLGARDTIDILSPRLPSSGWS